MADFADLFATDFREKRLIRRNSLHFSLPAGNLARQVIVKCDPRRAAKKPTVRKWSMVEICASDSRPRTSSARLARKRERRMEASIPRRRLSSYRGAVPPSRAEAQKGLVPTPLAARRSRATTTSEDKMRAIVITAPGVENNLSIVEVQEPSPGPGQVLIDVAYGGCNFADTMIAKGTYPHPKGYPIVAGLEISGRIAALGPDVRGVAVGDRVAAFSEEAGGFAERCVVPAERLARIPDAMSLEVAATFPIQALTAWHTAQCQRDQAWGRHPSACDRRRSRPVRDATGGAGGGDRDRHGRHARQGQARAGVR